MAEKKSTESTTKSSVGMTAAEKIAAARKLQAEKEEAQLLNMETQPERKREFNLVKHTETIDRLVLQNKQLQKDLTDADLEIGDLEVKLSESYVKISKNLLYTVLAVMIYITYTATSYFTNINTRLIEMSSIMKDYKSEIERTKMYNDILNKQLEINKGK